MAFNNGMRPVHPGEVLREDYLKPLGLSAHALAKALHVPASRINDIVLERRGITPDTALRLTRYFGGNDEDALGWLQMQAVFDFKMMLHNESNQIRQTIIPRADVDNPVNHLSDQGHPHPAPHAKLGHAQVAVR